MFQEFLRLKSCPFPGLGTWWPRSPVFTTHAPSQGSCSQHGVRQRALQSLERYFYLVLFNYYLHEQVGLGVEWNHEPSSRAPSCPVPHTDWHGVTEDPCGAGEESGDVCVGSRGRWVWGHGKTLIELVVLEQVMQREGPPLSSLGPRACP